MSGALHSEASGFERFGKFRAIFANRVVQYLMYSFKLTIEGIEGLGVLNCLEDPFGNSSMQL